jgi:hypothetical protein
MPSRKLYFIQVEKDIIVQILGTSIRTTCHVRCTLPKWSDFLELIAHYGNG